MNQFLQRIRKLVTFLPSPTGKAKPEPKKLWLPDTHPAGPERVRATTPLQLSDDQPTPPDHPTAGADAAVGR